MDSIKTSCPTCKKIFRVPLDVERFRCTCGRLLAIPAARRAAAIKKANRSTVSKKFKNVFGRKERRGSAGSTGELSTTFNSNCIGCNLIIEVPRGCSLFECASCGETNDQRHEHESLPIYKEIIPMIQPIANSLAPLTSETQPLRTALAPHEDANTITPTPMVPARASQKKTPNTNIQKLSVGLINVTCSRCLGKLKPPLGCVIFTCTCGTPVNLSMTHEGLPSWEGTIPEVKPEFEESSSFVPRRNPALPSAKIPLGEITIQCHICLGNLSPPLGCVVFTCACGTSFDLTLIHEAADVWNSLVPTVEPVFPIAIRRGSSHAEPEPEPVAPRVVERVELTIQQETPQVSLVNAYAGEQSQAQRQVGKQVNSKLTPKQVIKQATKGKEYWLRNLGPDEKLFWVRLLSPEAESNIKQLLKTWESDMQNNIHEYELADLQLRLQQLGLESTVDDFENEESLRDALLNAKSYLLNNSSMTKLSAILNHLCVDYTTCTKFSHYVERLMAAVWYGPTRLSDGFVREFDDASELQMVPAQKYGLPLQYKEYRISNNEIERMSQAPFQKKLAWFKGVCDRHRVDENMDISVNRNDLLQSSFYKFFNFKPEDFRKRFKFTFSGEEGIDAGGVSREWFELVVDSCFNLDFGLFEYSGVDNICYQFNPASAIANELDEGYFKFLGRVVGKSLFDNQYIRAFFTQPIYKHILGYPITVEDIQYCDKAIYDSLKEMQETEDVSLLMMTFSLTTELFGQVIENELKPGGLDIEVTKANIQEYIMLMMKHYMFERTKTQLSAFLQGVYEVVPEVWLSVFDYRELELLLCGLPNINVKDWKKNTRYKGMYSSSHKVIKWFWSYVESLDEEQKARLLQFCTGTSRVPVSGFSGLQGRNGDIKPFTLVSVPTTQLIYPRAHTCFNRIDLPLYKSKKDLFHRFHEAVSVSATGFNDE